jgi:hypothetical protein
MALIWTAQKITQLSLEEVKRLAENAKIKGNEQVVELCIAEIQARKTKTKRSNTLPDGFERVARSAIARSLERDVVDLLVRLAGKLNELYDLSTETARHLSVGTKRFIPHSLTDTKGMPKVGGAQKAGLVVFDRYISYRLENQIFALLTNLDKGEQATQVKYQVTGPKEILTNAVPISELRPYLASGFKIGIFDLAEEFDNFEEAAQRFTFLLEQVAPKR